MLWIVIIVAILLLPLLLLALQLRFRLVLDESRQFCFFGLGRSGARLDFRRGLAVFSLSRFPVRRVRFGFPTIRRPKAKKADDTGATKGKKKDTRPAPLFTLQDILEVGPQATIELVRYSIQLVRDSRVEELRADIQAGFDSPDLTGRVFGYYQAAAGALPATYQHVVFTPDWTGESLRGAFRCSVALPLYRLVYRTLGLAWRLPIKKIVKIVRGNKKGDRDVK